MQLQHKSCRCSAAARRYSSWLNHAIALLSDFIGETAFAGIAPLADAAQSAIVQPFKDGLFVGIIHQKNFKLASGASGNLLAICEAYALTLCGLGTKRTLALCHFAVEMNGNHARLNENQAINDLFVGGDLARFIYGLFLASFGLATDSGEHTARILEKSLDLIVVQNRLSVLVARKDSHAFVGYGICAQRSHFVLNGCSIRGLAGDELAGDVLVAGAMYQAQVR